MNGPDGRVRCACRHLLSEHGRAAGRPCSVERCNCTALRPAARACCANCGHPASFRTDRLADGSLRCSANGCTCVQWTPRTPEGEPSSTMNVVSIDVDGRVYRVTFLHPTAGESTRLRVTPTGQVQMEFVGRSPV